VHAESLDDERAPRSPRSRVRASAARSSSAAP